MKKLLAVLAAVFAISSSAHAMTTDELARTIMIADAQASALNLINWKVGEYADMNVTAIFGEIGKMHKEVASEQGNAIWVKQEMTGMMAQTMEILMDRADGHIIEARQNGQKTEIPNDKLEIIDQDTQEVTVPAGKFQAIHVTFKSEKIKKGEVWANPRDIPMDGAAKMVVDAGMITVTMELTKFGGK
jgi:hypothetical protein